MEEYSVYNGFVASDFSVLVTDDNPQNLMVISTMLNTIGVQVRVSRSGDECLKSIRTVKPDLLLLDIHMPGMDGYEVCKIITADEMLNDIPVIFVSALSEEFNKEQAFMCGGVDYITKPYDIKDVELRVKTHLMLKDKAFKLRRALNEIKEKETRLIESEKMAALGVLSAGIAHEINNPVNFISNSFKALKNRMNSLVSFLPSLSALSSLSKSESGSHSSNTEFLELMDELKEDLPEIYGNISSGLNYISDIVKSLRVYSGVDTFEKNEVIVNEIINSALTILVHRYKERIGIVKEYGDIPKILSHPAKLNQVIINLLSNSIDAIEDRYSDGARGGEIVVSTMQDPDDDKFILISIKDNGSGISKENERKIFDPFYTTKEVGKGVGLGLSICRNIINDMDGDISFESDANGTIMKIRLPVL